MQVDDDLKRNLKARLAKEGLTLRSWVENQARAYLSPVRRGLSVGVEAPAVARVVSAPPPGLVPARAPQKPPVHEDVFVPSLEAAMEED